MAKIITIAQQKGGAGKTTLLVQLAHHWQAAGRRVALIDLDPQGSLTRWAKMRGDMECRASADWKAASEIRSAARTADIVLVDCPGGADILLRATIRDSDLVLAPAQSSPMDIWALEPVVEMAAKEKTPLRVVLNRVPPAGKAEAMARAEIGEAVCAAQLGNRVVFQQAFGLGKAAAEVQPKGKAATEVTALAEELEPLVG
ncbi:ParA family protein [Roseobacter sp. HKCCA0434]|uniref:ParA family protein n=1 Tax=Roseobacter sp. HKCCA0434 TaxID=3079297 RepID=UPI002905F5F5|nr:ParA family protein [Roseobacter sp. HKCCA0434]